MYTYSLTGKIFYWSNSGGLSLYWISSPYEYDLGDWHAPSDVDEVPALAANHQEFFDYLDTLTNLEQDEALKKQAISNITQHPSKYAQNIAANIGRLIFDYPYSTRVQKLSTYYYIVPNMFLCVAVMLALYLTYAGRHVIPYEIYASMIFMVTAFAGLSLLSAYNRQFVPLIPILVLWIAFTLTQILQIGIQPQALTRTNTARLGQAARKSTLQVK